MTIEKWDRRYRSTESGKIPRAPEGFVTGVASGLAPGKALDLACGAGRHALWFAARGWDVTAVDGSPAAIDSLRAQASAAHMAIDARVADLEKHEFPVEPSAWDLVLIWLYLQRDLFATAKAGVRPGGILIASVRLKVEGEEAMPHRAHPGELKDYFSDWEILDYAEGVSKQPGGAHSIARIAVRRLL